MSISGDASGIDSAARISGESTRQKLFLRYDRNSNLPATLLHRKLESSVISSFVGYIVADAAVNGPLNSA